MKKILLIGFLAIFIQSISAQICHSELTRTSVLLKAVSTEIENQSGQVSYKLAVFAKDSVWLDSISVDSSFHSSFQTSFNFPKFLDSGDSDTIIIELDYDSNALPYYFKTIDHRLYTHGTEVSSSIHLVSANIYFTPYESTEVWNMDDFSQLPRIWEIPFSPEPARVSIHKDSIPESNRPDLDSIQYEWQTEFQKLSFPGLPYAIEMAAAHPDSLAWYIEQDSINAPQDTINDPNSLVIGKTFKGRVRGRLLTNIRNDVGDLVQIPLAGIRVKLKEDDIFGNAGGHTGYNITLTKGYTDDEGFFDLSYSVFQSVLEGNQIEPYLEFMTKSDRFNFKVKRKGAGDEDNPYTTFLSLPNLGKNADVQLDPLVLEAERSYPFRIANWTHLAFRFFEDVAPNHKPDHSRRLKIKLYSGDNSDYLNILGYHRIRLADGDERHETVLWHEIGHFVMWAMMPDPNDMLGLLVGSHSSRRENNYQLAWSEGWATGFMDMLDFYYRDRDNEHGHYGFDEAFRRPSGILVTNNYRTERISLTNNRLGTFNNNGVGIRSEYLVGCVLGDIFDGANRSNLPVEHNDEAGTNFAGTIDGFDPGITDEVNLDANTIFKALDERQSTSISEYYKNLLDFVSDCKTRRDIKIIFDQNRVNLNTSDIGNAANNFSSDEVGRILDFNDQLNWYTIFDTDVHTDREFIRNPNENYNIASNLISGTLLDKKCITDNLTIVDNGIFSVNKKSESGWSNVSGEPFPVNNSNLTLDIYSNRISINNNGTLEIGDINGLETGNAILKGGSKLIVSSNNPIEPAKVLVNNNSRLIIEKGAELHLFPNYQIILDGPNAILHIKGDVVLEDNTDFEVFGGPNGKGYVIWESNYISPNDQSAHLITGTNCNVKFSQNGWGVKALECRGNMGFQTPWTLNNLEIRHCTVQLMEESQIESLADNTMVEDVIIRGHLSSHVNPNLNWKLNSRGFKQLGRRNSFKKVRFIECTEGITIFNNGTSAPLKLEDVEFLSCNIGIRNWAGRIHWNGGSIKQNYIDMGAADVNTLIGVKGIGGQSVSLFNNVEMLARDNNSPINPFTTESTYNMHLHGSGRYQIYKSKLYDADYGIYSNQEHIHSWCSEYKDNVRQLTLHQETVLGLGPRRWNTIHFTGALGSDHRVIYGLHSLRLLLNNGANRFLGPDGSPGLSAYISASLDPTQTYVPSTIGSNTNALMGAGNEWLSSPNPGTGLIYFPDPMFNSFLTDPGWNQAFDINHNPAYSPAPGAVWEMEKNAFCNNYKTPLGVPSGNGWMPLGGGFVDETHARYGAGSSMNSYDVKTIFLQNGNPDANAVKNLMHDLYQTSSVNPINYQNLINQGMQLSLIDFPNEIAWVNYDLYKLVQDIYPELHTDPFYSDVAIAQMEPLMYHQLIQWSNGLMMKANESTSNWRHFKFELVRDRALIHRNFGHRQEALNWLNQEIPNFTKPQDIAELHNWHCIIATEQEYLDNNITLDQLFEYGCLSHLVNENLNQALIWDPTDFFSVLDGDGFIKEEEEDGTPEPEHNNATIISLDEGLSVYPNPSSSLFNYRNPQLKAISNIKVYSANGILIRTIQNPDKEGSIDLSSNSNGVYMITFELPNRTIQTKVILMR